MDLSEEFIRKYKKILGEETAKDFFATFDTPPVSGFRVHPRKNVRKEWLENFEKIPTSRWGYYGKVSGRSVEFLTGAVYSQEPAAQRVGELAGEVIKKGSHVLDLCAAPGGKSTHLLSYLGETGLLVANEISQKRSRVLVENLERAGYRNYVVLNESPERLAKVFSEYFDVVVVDAPCSGEGMFRKDPEAMRYWHKDYPTQCASLQREILSQALTMLKAGGVLVYSTCTWAPEEDEQQVEWLIERGVTRVSQEKYWSHEFRGEGQFVAKLIKASVADEKVAYSRKVNLSADKKTVRAQQSKASLSAEQMKLWKAWEAGNLLPSAALHGAVSSSHSAADQSDRSLRALTGQLQVFGEQLYLLPEGLPDLSTFKISRNGLHLGTFKKNRFEPSIALGLALRPSEAIRSLALTEEEFYSYMSGLTLSTDKPNGWYLLTVAGNGLTFAKISNKIIKNNIPKGLRITNERK